MVLLEDDQCNTMIITIRIKYQEALHITGASSLAMAECSAIAKPLPVQESSGAAEEETCGYNPPPPHTHTPAAV